MIYTIPFSLITQRRSPIVVERRDLVINAGDDFRLALTLYQDEAATVPLELDGVMILRVYCEPFRVDGYGWGIHGPAPDLTLIGNYQGSGIVWFDFIRENTANLLTGRYWFAIYLTDTVIAKGIMNIDRGIGVDSADPAVINGAIYAGFSNNYPVAAVDIQTSPYVDPYDAGSIEFPLVNPTGVPKYWFIASPVRFSAPVVKVEGFDVYLVETQVAINSVIYWVYANPYATASDVTVDLIV